MIISPVKGDYKITQNFWGNEKIYKKFWLKWHNGQDIALPIWTEIFSPIDWMIKIKDSQNDWYGNHLFVTEQWFCRERRQVILAHLSKIIVEDWTEVKAWDLIWFSGNTWFSTWPHLHWWIRRIMAYWRYKNYDNWYFGYEDIFNKWRILEHKSSKY